MPPGNRSTEPFATASICIGLVFLQNEATRLKLLLIEDEPDLAAVLIEYLSREGYQVEHAATFPAAQLKVGVYDYACIIADIVLPGGGTGLEVLRDLKKVKPEAAFILISARGSLDDRLVGLDLGADDYLPKPFHLSELNARLRALLRRRFAAGNAVLVYNEIKIFPDDKRVAVHDAEVVLTRSEYDLLMYLMANKSRVLTKEQLAEALSGDDADQADSHDFLYSHIKNLRKKLVAAGAADYLQSVYGVGYKFGTVS